MNRVGVPARLEPARVPCVDARRLLAEHRQWEIDEMDTAFGRPRRVARTVREMVRGFAPASCPALSGDCRGSQGTHRDRVAAYRELLDLGWGKADSPNLEGADPLETDEVAREIQQIADESRAKHAALREVERLAEQQRSTAALCAQLEAPG